MADLPLAQTQDENALLYPLGGDNYDLTPALQEMQISTSSAITRAKTSAIDTAVADSKMLMRSESVAAVSAIKSGLVTEATDKAKAYTDATVAAAVVSGVDPAGLETAISSQVAEKMDARGPVRVSVGETNHTQLLKDFIADLAAGRDRGSLRPGVYVAEGLVLPPFVHLDGLGGGTSRYGLGTSNLWGAVTIRRPSGSTSTEPIIHQQGAGSRLTNITLDSNGSSATALVTEGFEAQVRDVRIIRGNGIAWDVWKANNAIMDGIWIDNHGGPDLPSVRIRSVTGAGSAGATNAQVFRALTIERAPEVALQLGDFEASSTPLEWVSFFDLHVESPDDGLNDPTQPGNTKPLIQIGNVKGIHFVNPFIYGGPGHLIEHLQNTDYSVASGGIRITGGELLGQESWGPSDYLVHLADGDNFAADGTKFSRFSKAAIKAESAYGGLVQVSPTCTASGTLIEDNRTAHGRSRVIGDLTVKGASSTLTQLAVDGRAGSARRLAFQTSGVDRWHIQADGSAETGGAAGSGLDIRRRSDTGTDLGSVLSFARGNGAATFGGLVTIPIVQLGAQVLGGAGAAQRGQLRFVQGAAGEADQVYVCVKKADDGYTWKQIA